MDIESFREYCLSMSGVTEEFPFNETTLVFKVMGKLFVLTDIDSFEQISLKADPEDVVRLQEQYDAVSPGYHLNKRHWITVRLDGTIRDRDLFSWISASYALVVKGLPKSMRG